MFADEMSGDWPTRMAWRFAKGKSHDRHLSPDDVERFAALRHLRGGSPFGAGPMFGNPFGGGRGRARRGDVRLALLLLLAEEPRNGYQLMQEIEERSGGRWRPSPGSVYPTLAQLEDEGLVRATEHEGSKVFELTDAGRTQLAERADAPAPWELGDDPEVHAASELRGLIGQVARAAAQVMQVGDEAQKTRAVETLSETRRALYRILAEEPDA